MKICWDNLENIRLTKRGNFKDIVSKKVYYFIDECKTCKNSFLKISDSKGIYCSLKCIRKSDSTKKKLSKIQKKRWSALNSVYKTEKYKKKISRQSKKLWQRESHRKHMKMFHSPTWDGGYTSKNIPTYSTYAPQIKWCEEARRNKKDKNILEVKCTYCGKWFVPKRNNVKMRIQSLNETAVGENRLYCSEFCKSECPIYRKIKYPKGFKIATSREVQPELRQMVFERDRYNCQKCGSTKSLHCHHLEGIRWEPLLSADIDMCVTLCKSCHKEAHRLPDCGYNDLVCIKK